MLFLLLLLFLLHITLLLIFLLHLRSFKLLLRLLLLLLLLLLWSFLLPFSLQLLYPSMRLLLFPSISSTLPCLTTLLLQQLIHSHLAHSC